MADLGPAIFDAAARGWTERDWRSPANLRQLAHTLAEQAGRPARFGNTLLANALGVTPRTVQRWTTETASQRRTVNRAHAGAVQAVAGNVGTRQMARQIATQGVTFDLSSEVIDPSGNIRNRHRTAHLTPEQVPELPAALAAGNPDAAAHSFMRGFFEQWQVRSYGQGDTFGGGWGIGDVERLRLS